MSDRNTFAIVGGGQAAAEAAKTLRAEGFDGRLVIVGDEPHHPYERPPLSKEYLRGEAGPEKLLVQPPAFYDEARIELLTGRRAVGLDLATRALTLDDGQIVRFDRLLLATGSRAIRPAIEGIDRPWVHLLRTIADADRLRDAARGSETAVVAGGGWIAAETAASLRQMGLGVTLVVPGAEVLEKHLGPEIGATMTALHVRHGVRVVRRARVVATADGRAGRGVRLEDGEVVQGDVVVMGFGAAPAVELAIAAGLPVAGGILVDEHLMTEVPGVFAAGDVASAWHPRYRRHTRSEHWDNARRQGRAAARSLLDRAEPYERLPYFFSDQFELGMEAIGRPGDGDRVLLRAEPDGLIALWLRDQRVVAGMHANTWDAKKGLERLVAMNAQIDPGAFRDPATPFSALVPSDAASSAGAGQTTAAVRP